MGLAFCGALFLCAAKLAKVLQKNCKNCTVYIETAGRVWYALGVGRLHKTERSIGYETDVKDENLVCCVGSCVRQRRGLWRCKFAACAGGGGLRRRGGHGGTGE